MQPWNDIKAQRIENINMTLNYSPFLPHLSTGGKVHWAWNKEQGETSLGWMQIRNGSCQRGIQRVCSSGRNQDCLNCIIILLKTDLQTRGCGHQRATLIPRCWPLPGEDLASSRKLPGNCHSACTRHCGTASSVARGLSPGSLGVF